MRLLSRPALRLLLLVGGALPILPADAHAAGPLPVVDAVDLERYMGTWHEIAHMPNAPQKGCTDTTVHYRLNEKGFELINACWKGARFKAYQGMAKRVEPGSNAKFRVKFFLFFGGDYWIVDLDPEYRWAVVGEPARRQLWIISRERSLEEGVYRGILARARALGYDTDKLERAVSTGKESPGF